MVEGSRNFVWTRWNMSRIEDIKPTYTDLKPGDEVRILELYRSYRASTYSPERVRQIISELPSVGVRYNGDLIAFSYFEFFSPDIVELGNMFVRKDWRNRGLGEEVIARMEEQAESLGYQAIILTNSLGYETLEPKQRASRFYERCGYINILHTEQSDVFVKKLRRAK